MPDEVKLLPCDEDVRLRLLSVAKTLETCGKHGIPIDFALLASDIRKAIEATRPTEQTAQVFNDDGLSGMWKVRAQRAEQALEKLESYCFGLETQARGFRPECIRELFAQGRSQ